MVSQFSKETTSIHNSYDMYIVMFLNTLRRIRGSDNTSLSEGGLVHFEVQSCHHAHGVFFMDAAPLPPR
jgi:hypothetical protein